ncbi:related to acetyltransferase [Cephalotrichum gorgonifer]|uniref:Related to acetyltransferase n=1 Tax=Cephalotrichum gorgonifer TaxID=2041049 RepID=A0AAE8MVZ8_9PEZI|nr:related to acetyltransferase [Cephalotrichum gorgonifer]
MAAAASFECGFPNFSNTWWEPPFTYCDFIHLFDFITITLVVFLICDADQGTPFLPLPPDVDQERRDPERLVAIERLLDVRDALEERDRMPESYKSGAGYEGKLYVKVILDLIQELADYEKESNAVEATEETLLNTIAWALPTEAGAEASPLPVTEPTSPARPARCILAYGPEGTPVGMALYFYSYSTWRAKPGIFLEDLYVRQSERKKGYGNLLLKALAKEVVAMGGGRLEWNVLKWNEPSIGFYQSIGAQRMDDWVGMRLDREGLEKLASS